MMTSHRLAIASLFCLLTACGGSSDTVTPTPVPEVPAVPAPSATLSAATITEIDGYVQAQLARQHIPGLAVVVTMDGKPVLAKGYGLANMASKTPVTPDSVFRIGSVSKQFAATGIMLLVQEGKMGLDDPMSKYLPTAPAAWAGITVRQLMQHTSGLPRDFPIQLLEQVNPANLPSIDALVSLAGQLPLDNKPGAAYSYSNIGYHLLGFVLEKASGKYYADFLRERLFTPLGMSSATTIRNNKVPAMATGYMFSSGSHQMADDSTLTPGLIEAEGGLQMSASDLAKWDAALLTDKYLSKQSLAQMLTPAKLNDGSTSAYGLGWAFGTVNKRPYSYHNGSVDGFSTQFDRHTGEGLSVIVLSNLDRSAVGAIAARISAIVKPELEWAVAASDPQPATTALAYAMFTDLAKGKLVLDERFTAQVRAEVTPADLEEAAVYFAGWAPVERLGFIDHVQVGGVQVSRYLARTQFDRAVIGIGFDANGKVAFLALLEG